LLLLLSHRMPLCISTAFSKRPLISAN
jgi:hypothetical protein